MSGAITSPPWTPADDAWLRAFATSEPAAVLARQLRRSESAVFHRTRRLGILKRRRWTRRDDNRLLMLWGLPLSRVAAELGRTQGTTYWRAQKLGLQLGCPEGYEYLTHAARRCGYDGTTLRMILRWAGVDLHRALARSNEARRCPHFVDPDKVDDAVAAWLRTETPEAAGRRVGLAAETVIRRLMASGLPLPPRMRRKRHWRIPSDTIDRALAMVVNRGNRLEVRKEDLRCSA